MEQWRIGVLGERLVSVSIHSSITPVLHHSKSRLSGFSAPSKHNPHTLGFSGRQRFAGGIFPG